VDFREASAVDENGMSCGGYLVSCACALSQACLKCHRGLTCKKFWRSAAVSLLVCSGLPSHRGVQGGFIQPALFDVGPNSLRHLWDFPTEILRLFEHHVAQRLPTGRSEISG